MKILDFSEFALTKSEMKQIEGQWCYSCRQGSCTLYRYNSGTGGYDSFSGQCTGSAGPINPQGMDCFCQTDISYKAVPVNGGNRSRCYAS